MNISQTLRTIVIIAGMAPGAPLLAAEMDHSKMDHSVMGHDMAAMKSASMKGNLSTLREIPPSGRAREAGSDSRYAMEPTTVVNSLATQCAQASRGLIMLDNATWKRCGGKPKGASMGVKKGPDGNMDHSTMDHSKMKH
jgi:hypothetical protein